MPMKLTTPGSLPAAGNIIPSTLQFPDAVRFWLAIVFTGVGTGIGAAALTRLLEVVQHVAWSGSATNILDAAQRATPLRHIVVLLPAVALPRLGVPLGREGAPKQAGAVFANFFSDKGRLSDEQRRLLVACGACAGMGAAYGVPLGGALFALEVMRGKLALRFVLPALFTSLIATAVSWLALPDAPTYIIPAYPSSASVVVWALLAAPVVGVASVAFVRLVQWADRNKPHGWQRIMAAVIVLGLV